MSEVGWLTYRCRVPEADVEAIEYCLELAGAQAVSYVAASTELMLTDDLDGEHRLWPVCDVSGLFFADADLSQLEALFSEHRCIPIQILQSTLQAQDWQHTWREHFEPMEFGGQLCVCPSWREPPDPEMPTIRLDPGMAFGTGSHATTRLCLEWMTSNPALLKHVTVLDYGCGSGILAIAAQKLGAEQIVATDIDPGALEVCRANARANDATNIDVMLPSSLGSSRSDVLIANILLEPLLNLVDEFRALLRPGGYIVMSGILATQSESLKAAYDSSFEIIETQLLDEWALVAAISK